MRVNETYTNSLKAGNAHNTLNTRYNSEYCYTDM